METTVLEVKLRDAGNNETTLKIDKPDASTTWEDVQEAFGIGINAGIIYSRYDRAFDAVLDAVVVRTIRTSLVE